MKNETNLKSNRTAARRIVGAVAMTALVALPSVALATTGYDGAGAQQRVSSFFTNINGILNVASIAVVTIAVIFAGYQIAFNHKRISDVAPVLIGGFLIGAAAQIATMLMPKDVGAGGGAVGGGGEGGMAQVVLVETPHQNA